MKKLWAIAVLALLAFSPSMAQASDNLGISIDVLSSTDPAVLRVSPGQSLWFVVPPGGTQSREFIVTSSSSSPERVNFDLGFLGRVNGKAIFDDAREADSRAWGSFSPNNLILAPHASTQITFSYSIPKNIGISTHEAFLFATASAVSDHSAAQYQVPQNARIAVPVFLGVGTTEQIQSNFEIRGIRGETVGGQHKLRVLFANTGQTPIALQGNVQLDNLQFSGNHIGPLQFNSLSILPGKNAYVEIAAPSNLVEGRYEVFIEASQGAVTKTKDVKTQILFYEPSPWPGYLIHGAIVLIFIIIIFISWRVLRKGKLISPSAQAEVGELQDVTEEQKQPQLSSIDEFDLEGILEKYLNGYRSTKGASTRKAPVKRAATKKAPAKKAVAKKVVTKKPVAKKTTSKKPPVKKPPPKRSR